MEVSFRQAEGENPQPYLAWDSIWNPSIGASDWAIAPISTPLNPGGLVSTANLHTAIILCLFTDARAAEGDPLPDSGSNDARGWWGDGVDLEGSETALGSKLWLLYRSPLNAAVAAKAVDYAQAALYPLVAQGAVARFVVTSSFDVIGGRLSLLIDAYSQAGTKVYSQAFDRLWRNELR